MKTFKMEKEEKVNEEELQPKCNSEGEKNCAFKDEVPPYERKYYALLRRCESISLSNECLVNRIYHVKKLIRRHRKEREFLAKRLESYGDDYRVVSTSLLSSMFGENSPICSSGSQTDLSYGSLAPEPSNNLTVKPKLEKPEPQWHPHS